VRTPAAPRRMPWALRPRALRIRQRPRCGGRPGGSRCERPVPVRARRSRRSLPRRGHEAPVGRLAPVQPTKSRCAHPRPSPTVVYRFTSRNGNGDGALCLFPEGFDTLRSAQGSVSPVNRQ